MRSIILHNGTKCLVDDDDYPFLSAYEWSYHTRTDGRAYAARLDGNNKRVYMHRQIMGLSRGDKRRVDHKEPALTLDNRRSNLRICTQAQNCQNSRTKRHSRTGLKGAFIGRNGFYSRIVVNRRVICLGHFTTAQEAHAAYCEAAKKYHGEFARFE